MLIVLLHIPWISADAAGGTVQVAVHKANIRSAPSDTASVVAQADRYDRLKVLQEKFGWYQVQLTNGTTGWVAGYIVSPGGTANKNKDTNRGQQAQVTANDVNVRSHPSLSGAIIGKLHSGDPVTIHSESNGWVQITYQNQQAWISKQFIRFAGETNQHPSAGFAYISTDSTNLRARADLSAPVVTKGSAGERYPIAGQEGDWYKITLASGQTAYVASWVVSTEKTAAPAKSAGHSSSSAGTGLAGKTIVIDAGHGGYDPGTSNSAGVTEKQLTMQTAQRLKEKLKAAGANVILTRTGDYFVSLPARTSTSHSYNADAFISLHYDSSQHRSANGVTAYYYHGYQHDLARSINQVLDSSLHIKNRGTRIGNYQVIRNNNRPAALLELGYLSNPYEGRYVTTHSYQEQVANSIYHGLQSYFNQ
ncbi:N-acetylmuramoyl-L-alanine amidase [Siminovitchia sediminis]|uniref:N-acetylmuramoyl-L-alanine amidase n=1 Tax=Siminovitchia sediminis TaxID=1274353 RepID=A0ABW4KE67_9BACI